MRIRQIKPEFYRSRKIASLPWAQRFVLKALDGYVDDNGVGKDDIALFAADAFPFDLASNAEETFLHLQEAVQKFTEVGLVVRYCADGEKLLYVHKWKDIVYINKPAKGRLPRPDGTFEYSQEVDTSSYQKTTFDFLPIPSGTRRSGNQEPGDQEQSSSDSSNEEIRTDVEHLLDFLDAELERNDFKKPSRTKKNISAARRLLDIDGLTVAQVENAIRFAQNDEFWASNIRSMSKLREKYEQLRAKARQKKSVVQFDGGIDVDAILGHDTWSPPSPPADCAEGPAYQAWVKEQREQHKQQREAEARARMDRKAS